MKTIDYKTVKRWPTGHSNPHKNIVVGEIELESGHGTSDRVHVFKEGDFVYILTINHGLDYVGLDEYDLDSELDSHRQSGDDDYESIDPSGTVFLDKDYEIEETLGPRGLDLSPITICKRLMEHLPY